MPLTPATLGNDTMSTEKNMFGWRQYRVVQSLGKEESNASSHAVPVQKIIIFRCGEQLLVGILNDGIETIEQRGIDPLSVPGILQHLEPEVRLKVPPQKSKRRLIAPRERQTDQGAHAGEGFLAETITSNRPSSGVRSKDANR